MMFWAIQNKEINMAEVILERMKFAHAQIWDTKSKLNVSLPYAHLLTKEKWITDGVWTKTSVAEGEAIIGEAQEVQKEVGEAAVLLNQEESAAVAAEVQEEIPEAPAAAVPDAPIDPESARGESQLVQEKSAEQAATPAEEQASDFIQENVEEISPSDRRIEDIPLEHLVPVEEFQEIAPPSRIGLVLRRALESIPSTQDVEEVASKKEEAVASGHTEEVVMEDAPIQGEQEITVEKNQMEDAPTQGEQNQENEVVASCHNDISMEDPPIQEEQTAAVHDAPAEGEILGEKESEPQGERTENPLENPFREGETASSSYSDEHDDHVDQQDVGLSVNIIHFSSHFDDDKLDNIFCKGSVDTTIIGVDTMAQSKGRNVKKRSTSVNTRLGQVDTGSSQVDTRDLSQGIVLPVWDSVSTHLMGRSTHSGISVT
ncbi:hypothetical protein Taro_000371 [Colocasia esculenta]|uniref:Uncharacterized protein n=1 Tax=Colocasia esculenta TaxID=4460 RepID=A0A843T6U1_COLES|nr:hypothetical protein [Colocasia esculenta]